MDEIFWTFPASLHFDRRQYWHLGLRGILLRYFHLFSNFQVKWALQRHKAVIIKILTNFIIMELIIAFWWKLKIVWRLSTHSSMTRYGWPDWRHIGYFIFRHVISLSRGSCPFHRWFISYAVVHRLNNKPDE